MVNNAGTMPLAFWADHEAALDAWNRCIDINLKGIMNGIVAVHDQMISQGRGQVGPCGDHGRQRGVGGRGWGVHTGTGPDVAGFAAARI